jgi:hypothetical protein
MNDPVIAPLEGARIWLSGAIPKEASNHQTEAMQTFLRRFVAAVFKRGGSIIHGSQPTIRPLLQEVATKHLEDRGTRDALTLVVSQWFAKDPQKYHVNVEEWSKAALVHVTEEGADLQGSLGKLREWMSSRSDAVVALGGNWWETNPKVAGVPEEFKMARERGLPCFLLGGLGGAAEGFLKTKPEMLRNLRNGWDEDKNRAVALEPEPEKLADMVVDQLSRLPLVRGQALGGSTFRILALDGGGIKGAFTASVLAEWEQQMGGRIVDHFDMIAGTSTGGILACGLAAGLSASEMANFYRDRGASIFGRKAPLLRMFCAPKYDAETLRAEVSKAFVLKHPRRRVTNAECRLVLPACTGTTGEPTLLTTNHHADRRAHRDDYLDELAVATAAAPTYFRSAKIGGASYLDGGLWANNPVMAAIIEATSFLRVPLDRLDVLSISTTGEPFNACRLGNSGLVKWTWPITKPPIMDVLMNGGAQGHQLLAETLLGIARHLRVDKTLLRGQVSLDNVRQVDALIDHGKHAARHPATIQQVRSRFLNGVAVTPWEKY